MLKVQIPSHYGTKQIRFQELPMIGYLMKVVVVLVNPSISMTVRYTAVLQVVVQPRVDLLQLLQTNGIMLY